MLVFFYQDNHLKEKKEEGWSGGLYTTLDSILSHILQLHVIYSLFSRQCHLFYAPRLAQTIFLSNHGYFWPPRYCATVSVKAS